MDKQQLSPEILNSAISIISGAILKYVKKDIDNRSSSYSGIRSIHEEIYIDFMYRKELSLEDIFNSDSFDKNLREFLSVRDLDEQGIIDLATNLEQNGGTDFVGTVLKVIPYDRDYVKDEYGFSKGKSKEQKLGGDIINLVKESSSQVGEKLKKVKGEISALRQEQSKLGKSERINNQKSVVLKLLLDSKSGRLIKFNNIETLEKDCLGAFIGYMKEFYQKYGAEREVKEWFHDRMRKDFNENLKEGFDELMAFANYLLGNGENNSFRFQSGIKGFIYLLNSFMIKLNSDKYPGVKSDLEDFATVFSELDQNRLSIKPGDVVREVSFSSTLNNSYTKVVESSYRDSSNEIYSGCHVSVMKYGSPYSVLINLLETQESLKDLPDSFFFVEGVKSNERHITLDDINDCGKLALPLLYLLSKDKDRSLRDIEVEIEDKINGAQGEIFKDGSIDSLIADAFKQFRLRGFIKELDGKFKLMIDFPNGFNFSEDYYSSLDLSGQKDSRKIEKLSFDVENPKLNDSLLLVVKTGILNDPKIGDVYTPNGSILKITRNNSNNTYFHDVNELLLSRYISESNVIEVGKLIEIVKTSGNNVELKDGKGFIDGQELDHRTFIDKLISLYNFAMIPSDIREKKSLGISEISVTINEGALVFDKFNDAISALREYTVSKVTSIDSHSYVDSFIDQVRKDAIGLSYIRTKLEDFIYNNCRSVPFGENENKIKNIYKDIMKLFDEGADFNDIISLLEKSLLNELDGIIEVSDVENFINNLVNTIGNSEGYKQYWDYNRGPISEFQKGSVSLRNVIVDGEMKWLLNFNGEFSTLSKGNDNVNEIVKKPRLVNGGVVSVKFDKVDNEGWFTMDLGEIFKESGLTETEILDIADKLGNSSSLSGYNSIELPGGNSSFELSFDITTVKPVNVICQGTKLFMNINMNDDFDNIVPYLGLSLNANNRALTASADYKKKVTDFISRFATK